MTILPDIQTERLFITPFSEKHLTPSYVGWLNDSELMCYSENRHKTHTIDSCRAYQQSFKDTPNFFWAIEEIEMNNRHIGNINAYLNEYNLLADVGILIGEKQAQKKGYGSEAWMGVCDFLFKKKGIRKVTAGTMKLNAPMLKLMRGVGMVNDGVRKKHFIYNDEEVDLIHMAFFTKQWCKIRHSNDK